MEKQASCGNVCKAVRGLGKDTNKIDLAVVPVHDPNCNNRSKIKTVYSAPAVFDELLKILQEKAGVE
jgi:hypothetical protein